MIQLLESMLFSKKLSRFIGELISNNMNRRVAQLVEHRSPKPGVAGSSPASPALFVFLKND
tara:strand:- start:640 stop:822 length:183 start_codon:yes stop_codon:yes gene_type:complete